MSAGFHYHEAALGHGFQLVRGHEGALHHLQGLGVAVLTLSHRAGQDRAAAQISGQHLRRLAVWSEAPKYSVLTVIGEDFRALFSIVFL